MRTYEEIRDYNEFLRIQLANNSENIVFKKLMTNNNWKSYFEFQKQIGIVENIFRSLIQNSEILNYNAVLCSCFLLQVTISLLFRSFYMILNLLSSVDSF